MNTMCTFTYTHTYIHTHTHIPTHAHPFARFRRFFRYFHAFKFAFTKKPKVKDVCRVVAVEQPIAKSGMAEATAAEAAS